MQSHSFEVAIVGGGAAGLSAAVVLGRSLRRVVVVDAGEPRNAPAAHMHNFLSRDGMPPAELLALGRAEAQRYGVEMVSGRVAAAVRTADGFDLSLANGDTLSALRLLIATGLTDELPDVPGLRERWGRDVIHCPYCHGYEVRAQPIGVLGGEARSVHLALMARQLSPDVVFFQHTLDQLDAADRAEFHARDIRVVAGTVARVVTEHDQLTGVQLSDGSIVARSALFVAPKFVPNDALLHALGAELTSDPTGRTSVGGVWVAGNVVDAGAFVINAAAEGARAGAAINIDLVQAGVGSFDRDAVLA
jgi:thioredoxin reductase (NADPH)